VKRGVRIGIAHGFVQCGDKIEMFFARLVVGQKLLLQDIFKARLGDFAATVCVWRRPEHESFERVVRCARVAIRKNCDTVKDFLADFDLVFSQPTFFVFERPSQQLNDLFLRQRTQHVHLHARKQRRYHFKGGVLGSRSDQQNIPGLHMRQERILLCAIEAVHFVHKYNRAPSILPRAFRLRHDILNLLDARKHGAEGYEFRPRSPRNNPRERGLTATRRTPEKHRAQIVALNLCPQRLPRPEQFFLADKFIERLRAHAIRQRPPRLRLFFRRNRPKQSHYFAFLWRAASNSTTDAATPAFKDSTASLIGIEIVASAACSTSGGRPAPSLPINIAAGSRKSALSSLTSLAASSDRAPAAIIFTRAILNCASKTGTAIPRSTGNRSAEPAEARNAFGDKGSAVPRAATTPVAPNASADLIIVPTFPGSCTPTITTTSGGTSRIGPGPRNTSSNPQAC